jgi:hypothetical protein
MNDVEGVHAMYGRWMAAETNRVDHEGMDGRW